jgi:hypothetical protein
MGNVGVEDSTHGLWLGEWEENKGLLWATHVSADGSNNQ